MKHRQLLRAMLRRAVREHGEITKPDNCKTWADALTVHEHNGQKKLIFWFNSPDKSTKIYCADIKPEAN